MQKNIKKALILHTLPPSEIEKTVAFIEETMPNVRLMGLVEEEDFEKASRNKIAYELISCGTVYDHTFKIEKGVIKKIRDKNFDLVIVPADNFYRYGFKRAEAIALLSKAPVKIKFFPEDRTTTAISLFATLPRWAVCSIRYYFERYIRHRGSVLYYLLHKICRYVMVLIFGLLTLLFLVPFMFIFLDAAVILRKRFDRQKING